MLMGVQGRRLELMVMIMMLLASAVRDTAACNTMNCPGGGSGPLPSFHGDEANCSAICNATASCVGYVYQGGDATPLAAHCNKSFPHSRCYLKTRMPAKCMPYNCTCSGTNGRPPGPPPPFPVPPPPGPSPSSAQLSINVSNVTHPLDIGTNDQFLGCHADLGYSHQIQGFYSQKIYGESFEYYTGGLNVHGCNSREGCEMWRNEGTGPDSNHSLTTDSPFHGLVSKRLRAGSVVNRGFNQEGMSLVAGKVYEGYIFVRTVDSQPAKLTVSLESAYLLPAGNTTTTPTILASVDLEFVGGNWTQLTFSLTPNASTACKDFPTRTPPIMCKLGNNTVKGNAGHVCLQCQGQLRITSTSPDVTVDLDYAYLQPGPWGRFKGLPVNLDAVSWLQKGGYTMIRTGGTYVEADRDEARDADQEAPSPGYLWKKLRGPPWARPGGDVRDTLGGGMNGDIETRGWGIFEALQMCEAMGIQAVITLRSTESYQDLADLILYLFAPVSSASGEGGKWAQLRAADGHPEVYNVSTIWFEIGNEVFTQDFAGRAIAMETQATKLGKGGVLRYACPSNCHPDAAINASKAGLGNRAYIDIHDGAANNVFKAAAHLTEIFKAAMPMATDHDLPRAVVWETNTARHDFTRVLLEGVQLNQAHEHGHAMRLDSRAESFCAEKSGHDPCLDRKHGYCGDQGAIFFTAEQYWAQPGFYVHRMVTSTTGQDRAVSFNLSDDNTTACIPPQCHGAAPRLSAFSAISSSGKKLVLRLVNPAPNAVNLSLQIAGFKAKTAHQTTLVAVGGDYHADNPPSEPTRHSPKVLGVAPFTNTIKVPAVSFSVWSFYGELAS